MKNIEKKEINDGGNNMMHPTMKNGADHIPLFLCYKPVPKVKAANPIVLVRNKKPVKPKQVSKK